MMASRKQPRAHTNDADTGRTRFRWVGAALLVAIAVLTLSLAGSISPALSEERLWLWNGGVLGLLAFALIMLVRLSTAPTINLVAESLTFYPNRKTDQRLLHLRLNLSRKARVDIEIYDEFNRHVMSLAARQSLNEGEHFRLWDGRDPRGVLLGDGSYLIEVHARTFAASATTALWVRLDTTLAARRLVQPARGDDRAREQVVRGTL